MTPGPGSLSDALQRFNERARQKYRSVQQALVVATQGTASATVRWRGREVTLPISGPVALSVGEFVHVALREGRPYLILMNYGRRSGAIGTPTERQGGIVEVIFGVEEDGRTELYFRNWQEVVKLDGLRDEIEAEPTAVRWGADRKSFVVQTGTGTGRKFHVYEFESKPGDTATEEGETAGAVRRLRVEEPFASTANLRTLTADGQEWRTGMSVRLYVSAGRIRTVSYHYNPANPPGGLQIVQQTYAADSRVDDSKSPVSEQHAMLERPLLLGPMLSGALAGVVATIEDFGLDKERHLILTTTVSFGLAGAPVRGDGVLTRDGELLMTYPGGNTPPYYPLRDLLVEDSTAPGPDFYPYPTSLPTVGPVTAQVLSPYLHEGHALVIDATDGRLVFTTMREITDLLTDARVAYDGMSMLANTTTGTDNQRGANQRHVLYSYEWITTIYAGNFGTEIQGGAGESTFGSIVYHGSPYGTPWATVRANLDAAMAADAAGSPPKIAVETHFAVDTYWPEGPDGLANVNGTRRARGDLWREFGLMDGEARELREIRLGRAQTVVAQDLGLYCPTGEGATGVNYNTLPIGEAFMQRFRYYASFRWSLLRYHERRTLPVHYRVRRTRLVTFGASDAAVLLVVERVRNTADGAPVWTKHLGVFVCRFDGSLVSRLQDWTLVPTFDTPGAGRVIDPWFGGSGTTLYDDGSEVEVLGVSREHVLWSLSTLAQRTATPPVRPIYLSHVPSGGAHLVGTDLAEFTARRFALLGLDLLYSTVEGGEVGRHFIDAWEAATGKPTLEQAAKGYPPVDSELDPVAVLADLAEVSAGAVSHYHAVNDETLLGDAGREITEPETPYAVS